MIDFRYHVVSIVAVLFALAIGIVLGSGFLAEPLRTQLSRRLAALDDRNQGLIREGVERDRILDGYESFAETVQPEMTRGALIGKQVVLITVEGTDDATVDGLRDAIELAGGRIASTLRLAGWLTLDGQARKELRSIVGAPASAQDELLTQVADLLATRLAAASSIVPEGPRIGPTADERLEAMVDVLTERGYLEVERPQESKTAPDGALFLLVGGAPDEPSTDPAPLYQVMGTRLAEGPAVALAASPGQSAWGITESICDDPTAADSVSTVDPADTVYGETAAVLALDAPPGGQAGHYGVGSCATGVIPEAALAG